MGFGHVEGFWRMARMRKPSATLWAMHKLDGERRRTSPLLPALAKLERGDQVAPAPLSTVGGEGGWGGEDQQRITAIQRKTLHVRACPLRVHGRTEPMDADGRYGVGMRWLVLTPVASPASLESLR